MTGNHVTGMILREALELTETVARLSGELAAARMESANRLAAMRAALAADADGESDPLAYLRDEIGDWPPGGPGPPLTRDPYRRYQRQVRRYHRQSRRAYRHGGGYPLMFPAAYEPYG